MYKLLIFLWLSVTVFYNPINTFAQFQAKRSYYPTGKIKSISYLKGKKTQKAVLYYENGKKMRIFNFDSNGNLHGLQIEYYANGNKKTENLILGIELIPYQDYSDTVMEREIFVDVISCKTSRFFESGHIMCSGYVINGRRIGLWKFYNDNDSAYSTRFYNCLTKDE